MAGDTLADRCKRVPCQFFEHIVQPVNRLLRERPRHRRIVARHSFDAIDSKKKAAPGATACTNTGAGPPTSAGTPSRSPART